MGGARQAQVQVSDRYFPTYVRAVKVRMQIPLQSEGAPPFAEATPPSRPRPARLWRCLEKLLEGSPILRGCETFIN